MRSLFRLLFVSLVLIVLAKLVEPSAFAAGTSDSPAPAVPPTPSGVSAAPTGITPAQAAASDTATIPIGTVITNSNWQQYQQFMPDGMVTLFQGKSSWKMPADVSMTVGPTVIHPLPAGYLAATEKYSPGTQLV